MTPANPESEMSMDADRSFRAAGPFAAALLPTPPSAGLASAALRDRPPGLAVAWSALAVLALLAATAPAAAQPPRPAPSLDDEPLYAYPLEATPGPGCPYAGTPPNPQYPGICHPYPQPRPAGSTQTTTGCPDACFTEVITGDGIFPPSNPYDFRTFPGNNLLPTIYTNLFDGLGNEIPNTLPSTPDVPYNLHAATPVVSQIEPASPEDDLDAIFRRLRVASGEILAIEGRDGGGSTTDRDAARIEIDLDRQSIAQAIRTGLDILEGERVPNRVYGGFPLLHFNGPEKTKVVEPIHDAAGNLIGGNVNVHQIMYGGRIESDTAFLDPSAVEDVPWTITYTIDVLNRGMDDFSPYVMYLDNPDASPPGKPALPLAGMDQTFFEVDTGTRTVLPIAMAPGKYFKLVYAWGWRQHPPRVQVMENAELSNGVHYPPAGGTPEQKAAANPACPMEYDGLTLPQVEEAVFGPPPLTLCRERGDERERCEENRRRAIEKIGDVAPAKRMWLALREAAEAAERGDYREVARIVEERAQPAFYAWRERTRLPCYRLDEAGKCLDGVEPDPDSDITLLYVNNTTYGELTAGGWTKWLDWETRFSEWQKLDAAWKVAFERWQRTGEGGRPWRPPGPPVLDVTILNGDHYVHAYVNVDFGGNRGWENQFKPSVRVAGSGCWFTFGRNYWWINAGAGYGFICTPAADGDELGVHKVEIQYDYEPSRRLRFYQFDPFHHDVAVYSIH